MPSCFSRPICHFAMLLNDTAYDGDRQRLLSYVTRLACADTPEVERKRQDYIDSQMRKDTFGIEKGIEILEGALAIGRQAEPLAPETARTRLEAVRSKAPASGLKANSPLLKKVKGWFTADLEPAN